MRSTQGNLIPQKHKETKEYMHIMRIKMLTIKIIMVKN